MAPCKTAATTLERKTRITVVLVAASLLVGCSSAPRSFTPKLAAPATDAAAYERSHQSCKEQVAAGKREHFATDRGTAAGVGMAVGTGVAVAAGAGGGSSLAAAAAAGAAGAAALLVVAPLAIFATSRYIRSGKEDEIKQAMTACLAQSGYAVDDWELAREE